MKRMLSRVSLIGSTLLLPILAFAQVVGVDTPIDNLATAFGIWIPRLLAVLIAFAVIVFVWGVFKFVSAAGDEEKRKEGKQFIIWGIIGIAVMISVWALVRLLIQTVAPAVGGLNYTTGAPPQIPSTGI